MPAKILRLFYGMRSLQQIRTAHGDDLLAREDVLDVEIWEVSYAVAKRHVDIPLLKVDAESSWVDTNPDLRVAFAEALQAEHEPLRAKDRLDSHDQGPRQMPSLKSLHDGAQLTKAIAEPWKQGLSVLGQFNHAVHAPKEPCAEEAFEAADLMADGARTYV